jgi:hypothetical protein
LLTTQPIHTNSNSIDAARQCNIRQTWNTSKISV